MWSRKEMIKGDSIKTIHHLQKLVKNPASFELYVYEEFSDINARQSARMKQREYQWDIALDNDHLNRYCNILPFDKNRVRLNNQDYINASFVVPPLAIEPTYIAAQGPLRHTVVDFWRMVVEQQVSVIVCLTPEIEKNMEKCARYWPEGDKEWRVINKDWMIELKNTEEVLNDQADCIVRKISVAVCQGNTLVQRASVVQVQFKGWPDHGVPKSPDKVLEMIRLTRTFYKDKRPVVVHCSAGCGRTGTFCVIDSAERLIRQQLGPVDPILFLTEEFRKQRTTMVQTASQFHFCYSALLQFLNDKS